MLLCHFPKIKSCQDGIQKKSMRALDNGLAIGTTIVGGNCCLPVGTQVPLALALSHGSLHVGVQSAAG